MFITETFIANYQTDVFNEKVFFKKINNSYYSLESTTVKNFTVLLTSKSTENFARGNWNNNEIFPIQVIWYSPNRIFISEKGVPAISDTLKNIYLKQVNDLKNRFQTLLSNLKHFYFNGIYNSLSDNYQISQINNQICIQFKEIFKTDTVNYSYYFDEDGLCIKNIYKSEKSGLLIETVPFFRQVKTKWLIEGWEVTTLKKDKIQETYVIKLKNILIGQIWVPGEISILMKDSSPYNAAKTDILKLRGYLFNQFLKIIN